MFSLFFSKIKAVLSNPFILFIYGFIAKWYIATVLTAIIVTYWVFKGLVSSGLISDGKKVGVLDGAIYQAFNEVKGVAQHCTPKITNLTALWQCLQHTPKYSPPEEQRKNEELLQKSLESLVDINSYFDMTDPYEPTDNNNSKETK